MWFGPFTFWDKGKLPELQAACVRTAAAHWGDVRVISWEEFCCDIWPDHGLDLTAWRPSEKSDFVRGYILNKWGGLWVDTDVLVFEAAQSLPRLAAGADLLGFAAQGIFGPARRWDDAVIGVREGSAVWPLVWNSVLDRARFASSGVARHSSVNLWGSSHVVEEVDSAEVTIVRLPKKWLHLSGEPRNPKEPFFAPGPIRTEPFCAHLGRQCVGEVAARGWGLSDIMDSDTVIGELFRRVYGESGSESEVGVQPGVGR